MSLGQKKFNHLQFQLAKRNIVCDVQAVPLGGRLQHFEKAWSSLRDPYAHRIVKEGYDIPMEAHAALNRRPASVRKNSEGSIYRGPLERDLELELKEMLSQNIIERIKGPQKGVIRLMPLRKKDGGIRVIVDPAEINQVLPDTDTSMKMEGPESVKDLLMESDLLIRIDLKSAFYNIPISEELAQRLCFRTPEGWRRLRALPQGLRTSPKLFTRLTRPLMLQFRKAFPFVTLVDYIDDILLAYRGRRMLLEARDWLLTRLKELGWVVNLVKSSLIPSRRLIFLGHLWDTQRLIVSLPAKRRRQYAKEWLLLYNEAQKEGQLPIRKLARIVGQIDSLRLMHRSQALQSRWLRIAQATAVRREGLRAWKRGKMALLDRDALDELKYWAQPELWVPAASDTLKYVPPRRIHVIIADASPWGIGCMWRNPDGVSKVCSMRFNSSELVLTHNVQEALAPLLSYRKYRSLIEAGATIKIVSDNIATVAAIRKQGSMCVGISQQILALLKEAASAEHIIIAEFRPGEAIKEVDVLSRKGASIGDLEIDYRVIQEARRRWGPLQLDLFATRHSTKCRQFVSWIDEPEAIAADAMSLDWGRLFTVFGGIWANPPWRLMRKVLRKLKESRCRMVVCLPVHRSKAWWSLAMSMQLDFFEVTSHQRYPVLFQRIEGKKHPKSLPRAGLRIALLGSI